MGCFCGKNYHSEDDLSVLNMEGTNIEIFSGQNSFKLYAVKNNEVVSKINIPKLWIEGKHCTIHTTNDVEIKVEGTTLKFSGDETVPAEGENGLEAVENASSDPSISNNPEMDAVDSAICPSNKKNLLPILKAIDTKETQDRIKPINLVNVVPDLMKKCRISHYASQSEFYITLTDNITCQQFIEDEGKSSVSGPFRQSLNCEVRLQCLIADGEFEGSRGVISHMEEDKITVKLLDIGREIVVGPDQLAGIPENIDFSHIEAQAIRCCLYKCKNNTQETADMLKYIVATDTPTKVHFVGYTKDTWHVSIIRTSNMLVKEYEPIFMALGYAPQPHLQSTKAYIGYVDECNRQLWLQRDDEASVYDQLFNICDGSKTEPLHSFNIGDPCLCKSVEDDAWYRAVICDFDYANSVTVQYIDYGNKEILPCINVKSLLKNDLMKHHPLSYPCILKNGDQISDYSKFHQLLNTTMDVTVLRKVGAFFEISITVGGMNIIEKLSLDQGFLVSECVPTMGEDVQLAYSHIEDDGRLWVQDTNKQEELYNMMDIIASTEHTPVESPSVGQYVCCKFTEDDKWYRAVIMSRIDDLSLMVRYIDFGNSETITIDRLKCLDLESSNVPCLAVECRLYDNTTNEVLQSETFADMDILSVDFTAQFLQHDEHGLLICNIKTDDGQVVCEVVRKNLMEAGAICSNLNTDETTIGCVPPFIVQNNVEISILVIDQTEDSVWVQSLERDSEFNIMSDKLNEHMVSGSPSKVDSDIPVGSFCIAMDPLDSVWYRSVVTHNQGEKCLVTFIDFGNSCEVETTKLFTLPQEFVSLPTQAIQCRFKVLRNASFTEQTQKTIEQLINGDGKDVVISGKIEQIDDQTYLHSVILDGQFFDDRLALPSSQDGVIPLTNGAATEEFEVGTWKNEEYSAIKENGVAEQFLPQSQPKDDSGEVSDSENNKEAIFVSADNSGDSSQDNQWADVDEKTESVPVAADQSEGW